LFNYNVSVTKQQRRGKQDPNASTNLIKQTGNPQTGTRRHQELTKTEQETGLKYTGKQDNKGVWLKKEHLGTIEQDTWQTGNHMTDKNKQQDTNLYCYQAVPFKHQDAVSWSANFSRF